MKDDGSLFPSGSLTSIRAGINRYITGPLVGRNINIITDSNFKQANSQLETRSKEWANSGHALAVKHKDPINTEDLKRIGSWIKTFAKSGPYQLQKAVWFLHNLAGAKRGIEEYRKLLVSDVEFKLDEKNDPYMDICFNRLITYKKHQGGLSAKTRDNTEPGHIYKRDNEDLCLYSLMQFYLSKMRKYLFILPHLFDDQK